MNPFMLIFEMVAAVLFGWAVFIIVYGIFWTARWFVTGIKTGNWGDENYRTSLTILKGNGANALK